MTIHEQIRAARLKKNWSMRQLAEEVSRAEGLAKPLAWQTVQQWESGVSAPKRKRMVTVGRLLGFETEVGTPQVGAAIFALSPNPVGSTRSPNRSPGSLRVPPLVPTDAADWIEELVLDATWAERQLAGAASLEALRLHVVHGDAMAPTCQDGEVVLVDSTVRQVAGEGIYVLRHGRLLLRRVRQRLNGALELVADNPRAAAPELLDATVLPQLEVIGRAVWVLRGAKL